jgi:hypothetical protein
MLQIAIAVAFLETVALTFLIPFILRLQDRIRCLNAEIKWLRKYAPVELDDIGRNR